MRGAGPHDRNRGHAQFEDPTGDAMPHSTCHAERSEEAG